MVICYGDSIYSKNKNNLKIFHNFFNHKFPLFLKWKEFNDYPSFYTERVKLYQLPRITRLILLMEKPK